MVVLHLGGLGWTLFGGRARIDGDDDYWLVGWDLFGRINYCGILMGWLGGLIDGLVWMMCERYSSC